MRNGKKGKKYNFRPIYCQHADVTAHHVDKSWIYDKIDGHGGCFGCSDPYGLAKIDYIGNKNSLQVFWYNLILYLRYVKRRIKTVIGGH